MPPAGRAVFEFGDFRVDEAARVLFRRGAPVPLMPKAFDTLLFLVTHADRVVTKAELLDAVWPGAVVEEANLTQNVSVARKALGESPRDHRYIVTVPGRGYRFAAAVVTTASVPADRSGAHHFCLRGRHLLDKRLTESISQAITCFLQATDEDPAYAPAWVGLADAYALLSLYGASMPRDVFPKSKAAALTALRFDPILASAHNSLGVVELFYEWNWPAAERALDRAIELDQAYGDAYQRRGLYLTAMGRFAEARAALERAQALDPLSRIIATFAGYPDYYSRQFDAAVQRFRHVLQLDPNFSMAHFRLGLAYAQQGRFAEAAAELEVSRQLSNDRDVVAALGRVYAMQGDRARALEALADLEARSKETFVPSYAIAVIHAALGDCDVALAWLERAFAERSYWILYLKVDPALDPLRVEARFADLLRRARLDAAPG